MGVQGIVTDDVHAAATILLQMVWFRENWYEELLRQLNKGLVMCQAAAFASRADGESFDKL